MLVSGDAVIGKTITTTEIGEGSRRAIKRDRSILVKHSDDAIVDAIVKSKNRDGSTLTKVRTRTTSVPIIGDKLCLTATEHEVLCTRGWVPSENVTTEDCALCYDPVTRTMHYDKVIETHAYKCEDDEVYEVNTPQISLKATLDHRMYVKREGSKAHELIRARDIVGKKVSYLKKCIGGLAKKQVNKPPLPLAGVDGAFHANDWLFLLGLYVRNGVAADNGHTVVMLSQTHAVLERLKTTCQNLQLKMTLTKRYRPLTQRSALKILAQQQHRPTKKLAPLVALHVPRSLAEYAARRHGVPQQQPHSTTPPTHVRFLSALRPDTDFGTQRRGCGQHHTRRGQLLVRDNRAVQISTGRDQTDTAAAAPTTATAAATPNRADRLLHRIRALHHGQNRHILCQTPGQGCVDRELVTPRPKGRHRNHLERR